MMQMTKVTKAAMLALAMTGTAAPVVAQQAAQQAVGHDAAHQHDQAQDRIAQGYFEDAQVHPRPLSDWAGDWQSVYPYLLDGTLDPVMRDKAHHGDKTAEEYKEYYATGYRSTTDRIRIEGDIVTFHAEDGILQGRYLSDGQEILTYAKGNRGVRYVFRKADGDAGAPDFIQFSDHAIAPVKAGHYHLYWGDDRDALLAEVTNWPTFYPTGMTGDQILSEMLAH